jgi:iron(III) transport system permease protein
LADVPVASRARGAPWGRIGALAGLALIVATPSLPVAFALFAGLGASESWTHIQNTLLWEYAATTLALAFVGTGLATLLGAGVAWLVASARFPFSDQAGWLLAMPLALPAYVSAYAWADMLGVRGPGVAILVHVTTLYPYVYLAARAAFAAQSVCALEAARSLGAGPWRRFHAVALPMARPAIAGGAALVALEIVADYGAADHLGVGTLTVGVFRAWFSMGDLSAAARLAALTLAAGLTLVAIERAMRRGKTAGGSTRWRSVRKDALRGWAAWAAAGFVGALLLVSLILPVAHLAGLALRSGPPGRGLWEPLAATAALTGLGAGFTLALAALGAALMRAGRRETTGWAGSLVRLSALGGYATPGAVTALGVLGLLAALGPGAAAGLAGWAGLAALVFAYGARFSGAGLEPIGAGLDKTTRSQREAAASLGWSPLRRIWRLDLPLAAPSVLAAALIVAIEIAKELPATTILRPLGFDTLAVRAHSYAADERLAAAAWPALVIVALSAAPAAWLARRLDHARAGAGAGAS